MALRGMAWRGRARFSVVRRVRGGFFLFFWEGGWGERRGLDGVRVCKCVCVFGRKNVGYTASQTLSAGLSKTHTSHATLFLFPANLQPPFHSCHTHIHTHRKKKKKEKKDLQSEARRGRKKEGFFLRSSLFLFLVPFPPLM